LALSALVRVGARVRVRVRVRVKVRVRVLGLERLGRLPQPRLSRVELGPLRLRLLQLRLVALAQLLLRLHGRGERRALVLLPLRRLRRLPPPPRERVFPRLRLRARDLLVELRQLVRVRDRVRARVRATVRVRVRVRVGVRVP